jgi:hypothetical protein
MTPVLLSFLASGCSQSSPQQREVQPRSQPAPVKEVYQGFEESSLVQAWTDTIDNGDIGALVPYMGFEARAQVASGFTDERLVQYILSKRPEGRALSNKPIGSVGPLTRVGQVDEGERRHVVFESALGEAVVISIKRESGGWSLLAPSYFEQSGLNHAEGKPKPHLSEELTLAWKTFQAADWARSHGDPSGLLTRLHPDGLQEQASNFCGTEPLPKGTDPNAAAMIMQTRAFLASPPPGLEGVCDLGHAETIAVVWTYGMTQTMSQLTVDLEQMPLGGVPFDGGMLLLHRSWLADQHPSFPSYAPLQWTLMKQDEGVWKLLADGRTESVRSLGGLVALASALPIIQPEEPPSCAGSRLQLQFQVQGQGQSRSQSPSSDFACADDILGARYQASTHTGVLILNETASATLSAATATVDQSDPTSPTIYILGKLGGQHLSRIEVFEPLTATVVSIPLPQTLSPAQAKKLLAELGSGHQAP